MTTHTWTHFIGGQSVDAQDYTEAFNPCSGEPVSKVAKGTVADVDKAVEAAKAALPEWRARKPMERGRVLLKIASALREKSADLSAIESAETGKPIWQSPMELEVAAQYFEFYGGLVNVFQGEVIDLGSGYHSYTRREPYGVVGVITPWNAPDQSGGARHCACACGGQCGGFQTVRIHVGHNRGTGPHRQGLRPAGRCVQRGAGSRWRCRRRHRQEP